MSVFSLLAAGIVPTVGASPQSGTAQEARSGTTGIIVATTPRITHAPPNSGLISAKDFYPSGIPNALEPSGEAPPSPKALPDYSQSYVSDFLGSSLPTGWRTFSGTPQGDPGGQWATSHDVVNDGMLQLNVWQDPAYGNQWVSGGLCQCGHAQTYGAYFVRSRATGSGPTQVELLWPAVGWPPEIDFDETYGGDSATMATDHFNEANDQIHRNLNIDMTQWHTWGIIWSPTSIIYTVDGRVWGTVSGNSNIPRVPMTLDLQQQTWCNSGWACPTTPQSLQIDWVAEYTLATVHKVTLSSFALHSASLTNGLKHQIRLLAERIVTLGEKKIELVGYSDDPSTAASVTLMGKSRAIAVKSYLLQQLVNLDDPQVTVTVASLGSANPVASNATARGRARNRRVVATLN